MKPSIEQQKSLPRLRPLQLAFLPPLKERESCSFPLKVPLQQSRSFSAIRHAIVAAERNFEEFLTPVMADLSDLTPEEKIVSRFVQNAALELLLEVQSIILFGSRATRSHHYGSDFDFGIEGSGS